MPYSGTGTFTVGAGTYTYTVTDLNGCTSNTTITVSEPTELTASSSAGSIMCNGGSTNVTVTGNGGTIPYSGDGTYTVNAGSHSYTVTDANGCTANTSINISEPTILVASSTSGEIACFGESTTVNVTATGGTPVYSWTGTFTVSEGTYNYTVTDANGCTANTSIVVDQPEQLVISDVASDAECNGLSGSATVSVVSGGTSPYNIIWEDFSTQFTNNNIPPDVDFTYTVYDANMCEASGMVHITEPDPIVITLTGTDLTCYNSNDGTASVLNITGGSGMYTYEWSNYESTPVIGNLAAGTYTLVATDNNNCQGTASITIYQPDELTLVLSSVPANCGNNGGTITAVANGGTPDYSFTWSVPGTSNPISDLDPGNYTCYLTDANGCSTSEQISIGIAGNIDAVINLMQPISCYGDTDGILEGTSPNGENPINYQWDPSSNNQTISNLGEGTYLLSVTDSWGCTGSDSYTLNEPEALNISPIITNVSCYGDENGSIIVSASNGTPPYTFVWNGVEETNNYTNLAAGYYSLVASDANDCSITQTFTVSQPDQLTLSYTVRNVSCYGYNDGAVLMSAGGGSTPYTYSVFDGNTYGAGASHANLPAGSYSLIV
ncbi:MAG: hypothetical protein C0596_07375 [Marinilabiliales bacterium]|nr:MAG: hypothetical protein C0596_07375 [Marinilabiliales bacterium]